MIARAKVRVRAEASYGNITVLSHLKRAWRLLIFGFFFFETVLGKKHSVEVSKIHRQIFSISKELP